LVRLFLCGSIGCVIIIRRVIMLAKDRIS
jgi:hypothetical protein